MDDWSNACFYDLHDECGGCTCPCHDEPEDDDE